MKSREIYKYLNEGENETKKCVICGKTYTGWGNDAWPVADGYCCDQCNMDKVIPARLAQMYGTKNESNLTEETKYHYITSANNPEDIGAEYEYNSMANTEVIDMLNEIKTYFTQAQEDAKEIIANASHDPGVYDSDVEMCKFCAEKAQEMLDKMNSTWE